MTLKLEFRYLMHGLGALSYIPGIGSDAKTDSGINKGKLATVIVMHELGLLAFSFEIWRTKNGWDSALSKNRACRVQRACV